MKTKLSIIIPCYNCEETLGEAVESAYQQEPEIPFDITMVDDASTDGTYDRMRALAARYPGIRILRHPRNWGGGATRNTAVAHSDGNLIFCLDSDDILGPHLLKNLTRFWLKKKCDGVGISQSIKFRGRDKADIAYITDFADPGRQVRFESLLDGTACSLTSTFLITRSAFNRAGGYPTTHAFDTQGFAFRFLGNGLTAYTCPETRYYHRVEFKDSYYVREQKADRLNWNWFNVLDEFLYLFNPVTRSRLLEADLFESPGRPTPPEFLGLLKGRTHIYARNYRHLIRIGRNGAARLFRHADDAGLQYWLGGYHAVNGDYRSAVSHYRRALELGFKYRIIYYRMLSAALRLSGNELPIESALTELALYSRPFPTSRLPLRQRVFRKLTAIHVLRGPILWVKRFRDRHFGTVRAV
jgi:glycosyltransferase involved in cell wall biosynthesis